ncbi:SMI1/KNR4 family protein SUKH-1 [Prosthecobacter fusiformis]|uniref:SMI1/KNR4 family protein SUKH-1 n=1 Tax=Prosthecobacter fusiformis TaxID=48464 RepID=A0A4R7RM46_9BACT|nr:SMI1/KNR4 family protein [Prosthecobacter fusiformis]TDU63234.1 SMI1/KNR4 family protein SUKH-1 [Prosthecobacter fusiformis]
MNEKLLKWLKQDQLQTPFMYGEAVPESELANVEKQIGFYLPDDYRQFVIIFGGGTVMSEHIFGLRLSETLGVDDLALIQTKRFREDGWPGVEQLLVISIDPSGNPIGLNKSGEIIMSDIDVGVVKVVAPDFGSYLLKFIDLEY